MRGLFIKDLCILKQRKSTILVFLIILFIIGAQTDISFVVSYGTLVFGFLAQSTVSYDDDGNCMSFLFTLPITVKGYAREKFLFTGSVIFMGWLASVVIGVVLGLVNGRIMVGTTFVVMDAVASVMTLMIFLAVLLLYIPIQLKFGPERSRMVLIGAGAVVFIVALAAAKFNNSLFAPLDSLSPVALILTTILVCALVVMGAYAWSVKILKAKEY